MDKYVVKKCLSGRGALFFYKNDLLHREAGPAIIMSPPISPNLNLGDEHLYTIEFLSETQPPQYVRSKLIKLVGAGISKFVTAIYYLEGQPYTKEDFEKLKAKIDLKENLFNELLINESQNNNKTKI